MYNIEPSFETFSPRDYLNTYYSHIGEENAALLEFYANTYSNVGSDAVLLEFSGGPTLYSLISAAQKVKEIHFSEYLENNLDEVRLWVKNDPCAFDWSSYVKKALEYEGHMKPTTTDILKREALMRKKITRLFRCDAFSSTPLLSQTPSTYDVISLNFVPESITSTQQEWRKVLDNVLTLLSSKGLLVMTAIKGANYYKVGGNFFPAVILNENDIQQFLISRGFTKDLMHQIVIKAEEEEQSSEGFVGYTGMVFTVARRT